MSQTTNEIMYSDWPLYQLYDQFSGGMWDLTDEQKKRYKKIKDEKKPRTSITQEIYDSNVLVARVVSGKTKSLEEQIKDLKNQNETLQTEKEELVKKSEEMQNNINQMNKYMDIFVALDDLEKGYQNDITQLIQHYEKKLTEEKEHNIKIIAELTEHHAKDLAEEKEHRAKEIRSRCDKNEKKIKMFREMIHRLKVAHPDIEELKLMTL
ncbi:hypothetical protein EIN_281380 [Entamoeba invadens IP1]|uniref:Uncharacterized protein n=1 Tax=Entamoeba invadens IP1 TaxID=370355 RepID=A0A0A1TX07_ENTIV|nr:hypothetical protein EIN_281380 [Entamoeba invadens IP1]ELP85777.1 hypothetical protein EIN_281380 [Entamoeba invadens IP1]|eukprot:XP_004185123.1 hypothetical protein EIN_281380 [Entamoeba invadens IP1]